MTFQLNNNHPLIRNQQNYYLDRRLITIHTEDRDSNKWPDENEFEITLPEPITNIQSMRLIEGTFPSNYYTFSEKNQNTKFFIDYDVCMNGLQWHDFSENFTLQDGFYTPNQMALELEKRIQRHINDSSGGNGDQKIKVFYDEVGQCFYFGFSYKQLKVTLDFKGDQSYNTGCNNSIIKNNNTKWGLGYYLGFEKKAYHFDAHNGLFNNSNMVGDWKQGRIHFDYLEPTSSRYADFSNGFPFDNVAPTQTQFQYYIKAPYTAKLNGEQCFYVEIEKYNECDELKPYSLLTNSLYNNDYNGTVKAAFAKIPIISTPNSEFRVSENDFLQNFTQFNPPLERITKLKFKFRYHDGRLVDFKKHEFNFTMELNTLCPEIQQSYNVRTPTII